MDPPHVCHIWVRTGTRDHDYNNIITLNIIGVYNIHAYSYIGGVQPKGETRKDGNGRHSNTTVSLCGDDQ